MKYFSTWAFLKGPNSQKAGTYSSKKAKNHKIKAGADLSGWSRLKKLRLSWVCRSLAAFVSSHMPVPCIWWSLTVIRGHQSLKTPRSRWSTLTSCSSGHYLVGFDIHDKIWRQGTTRHNICTKEPHATATTISYYRLFIAIFNIPDHNFIPRIMMIWTFFPTQCDWLRQVRDTFVTKTCFQDS